MTDAVLPTSTLRMARRRSPLRRKAFPYLLVAPAVVYLLAITLYPGIFALWRSFYQGRFKLEFIGFQNYVDLFRDEAFWHSLCNTLTIGGVSGSTVALSAPTTYAHPATNVGPGFRSRYLGDSSNCWGGWCRGCRSAPSSATPACR